MNQVDAKFLKNKYIMDKNVINFKNGSIEIDMLCNSQETLNKVFDEKIQAARSRREPGETEKLPENCQRIGNFRRKGQV